MKKHFSRGQSILHLLKILLWVGVGYLPTSTVLCQSGKKNSNQKNEIQSLIFDGSVEQLGSDINVTQITQKGGLIFITVNVDGNQYTFLFDTGAMLSVVSEEVVGNGKGDKNVIITDGFGLDSKKRVVKKDIKLNGVTLKNISSAIVDLSHIEKQTCLKIDGVLGANAINLLNWKIDPVNSSLYYSTKPFKSNFNSVNFDISFYSEILPLIEVNIYNNKFWALLDFGFSEYLTINHDLFKKLQAIKKMDTRTGNGSLFLTVTNQPNDKNHLINIDSLFINNHLYKEINVIVASNNPALGTKFFNTQITILNFTEKKVYVETEAKFISSPKEYLSSKFCLNPKNEIIVCYLWNDTPLERDGVKIGDKIISINGEEIDKVNNTKWCQFKEQIASGKEIELIIKSKSSTNKYRLSQLKL